MHGNAGNYLGVGVGREVAPVSGGREIDGEKHWQPPYHTLNLSQWGHRSLRIGCGQVRKPAVSPFVQEFLSMITFLFPKVTVYSLEKENCTRAQTF